MASGVGPLESYPVCRVLRAFRSCQTRGPTGELAREGCDEDGAAEGCTALHCLSSRCGEAIDRVELASKISDQLSLNFKLRQWKWERPELLAVYVCLAN